MAVVASALCLCFVSTAAAATTGWPMFQGNPQHAGQGAVAGPTSPGVAWTFAPNDGYQPVGTPPIVGPDGTVYVARYVTGTFGPPCEGREELVIDAVSPQGGLIWQSQALCGSTIRGGMAVAPDGTVYAIDGLDLVAIAPGGSTRWSLPINSESEVTIGPDGTLYVQDASSKAYAVNPANGQVLWTYAPPSGTIGVRGTPTLSPDGSTIYVGSGGGVLSALNTSGGLRWTLNVGSGGIENAPAVGPDGTIYIATFNGELDAVTPEGALKWQHATGSNFETTPTVANDGLIIGGNDAGTLVAVNAGDGSLAWTYQAPGEPGSNGFYNSSALIDSSGVAYIQNQSEVFAVDKEGHSRWKLPSGSYGSSFALDAATRHLYFVAESGLVALVSSPIEHAEYSNWKLSGSLTDKKLGQAIALPEHSTFNGSGELNTETGAGSVNGTLSVPPFTATVTLFGVLPVNLGMTFAEVGAFNGSVTGSGAVPGDEVLSAPLKLSVGINSLNVFGLQIPTACETQEPASLSLTDTLTREELLTSGWSFTGTTTLPRFKCQGAFGGVVASVLTMLLSGPANPFSLALSAPSR
jgi:outer membrane protein assembly factor BamB